MGETNDRKQSSYLKVGLLVVAVLLVVGVVIFSMNKRDGSTEKAANDPVKTESGSTDTKEITVSKKKYTFTIGETAEQNGVQVTLKSVIEAVGNDTIRPEDGNLFLICQLSIQNNSDEDISIQSEDSFQALCDNNPLQQDIKGLQTPANDRKSPLDGLVAAGKEMEGVIVYQVPVEWNEVRLTPSFDFWSSEDTQFVATKLS